MVQESASVETRMGQGSNEKPALEGTPVTMALPTANPGSNAVEEELSERAKSLSEDAAFYIRNDISRCKSIEDSRAKTIRNIVTPTKFLTSSHVNDSGNRLKTTKTAGVSDKRTKASYEQKREEPESRQPKKRPKRKRSDSLSTADPLVEALSKGVQEYLSTIHITKAAQLLMARTTDLAEPLPKWRKSKGMAELKGKSGALSIVSVWKRKVRKQAALVGATKLSQLNIGTNANPENWTGH